MKNSILSIALILVLSIFVLACHDDNNNNGNGATALTENDFFQDAAISADPEDGVVVTFLENPMSEDEVNDTGELGVDEVPYTYPETVEHTLCWEDENADAMHFAELRDSEDNLILTVEANGECVTELVETGDYTMVIHHDGKTENTLPIFLIPQSDEELQTRKIDGLFNRFKGSFTNMVKTLQDAISKEAIASGLSKVTLLQTNKCESCNLSNADLSFHILSNADLKGSDLSGADLCDADLSGADLSDTNLSNAIMSNADLSGANFSNANLTDAVITAAILEGATWCDGTCVCDMGSVGTCGGCTPKDTLPDST